VACEDSVNLRVRTCDGLLAPYRSFGTVQGHDGRIMVGRMLVEALMRSVVMEMTHILVNDGAGVSLVVDQQSVGALLANAANEPLGITVRSRRPRRGS
jgi:hypothetical protein